VAILEIVTKIQTHFVIDELGFYGKNGRDATDDDKLLMIRSKLFLFR
jgi:hypothetical protein